MQPYELAMVTGVHTTDTYYNAAEYGNLEYLQQHPQDRNVSDVALQYAAKTNQLDAIRLLVKLGAVYFGDDLKTDARLGQLAVIELFIDLGVSAASCDYRTSRSGLL